MSYVEFADTTTEYQGESFVKSLAKKSKGIWEANEEANFILTDGDGVVVASDDLVKSDDDLTLTFILGKTSTADLEGVYTLLVYQTDTSNSEINNVIARYKITYRTRKIES